MSNKTIYQALRAYGLTKEGACGLMGNMMAESSMKSNIAQRGMTKLTDEQYTTQADLGQIDFVRDAVGYGLCQWTYWSRKNNLILFAKKKGVSVGDEAMQVEFCLNELQSEYSKLYTMLRDSHDLYECARKVCIEYERPAVNNIEARFQFAQKFYNEFANGQSVEPDDEPVKPDDPVVPPSHFFDWKIALIQFAMQYDGYWGDVTGEKNAEFFNALGQYLEDMKK